MKIYSEYKLRKRIGELERRNAQLESDLYSFRQACSAIYQGCADVVGSGNTQTKIGWILVELKRAWK